MPFINEGLLPFRSRVKVLVRRTQKYLFTPILQRNLVILPINAPVCFFAQEKKQTAALTRSEIECRRLEVNADWLFTVSKQRFKQDSSPVLWNFAHVCWGSQCSTIMLKTEENILSVADEKTSQSQALLAWWFHNRKYCQPRLGKFDQNGGQRKSRP